MNITYTRDLDANYMVIEDESFRRDQYTLRMLEKNSPASFLKLSLKQMNGMTFLWYRITSMQPLERMYERNAMSGQEIGILLAGLDSAVGDVRAFLLESDDVVLDPAYIYITPDRKQVRFIYVPGQKELFGSSLKKLSEFILRKLDHRDPSAVEIGYELYDRIAGGEDSYSLIREELQRRLEEHKASGEELKGRKDSESRMIDGPGRMPSEKTEYFTDDGSEYPDDGKRPSRERTAGNRPGKARREKKNRDGAASRKPVPKAQIILAIAGCLVTAAVFALYIWLGDPDVTQIGGLFFGTLALVWLIFQLWQNRKEQGRYRQDAYDEADEEDFWNALITEDGIREEKVDFGNTVKTGQKPDTDSGRAEEEAWIHGETRALGDVDRRKHLVLVSQDIRRCRDLTIESAISLIGKSREMADVCIPLDVVSRVHARLDHTHEGIFLTDLNSMNGTYVNERRLSPNQRVPVKEGDLISFATVHFKLARRDY